MQFLFAVNVIQGKMNENEVTMLLPSSIFARFIEGNIIGIIKIMIKIVYYEYL